jgi:ATP-binding cassette subfamily B protein
MADIVDVGIKQRGVKDPALVGAFRSEAEILQNQTSYIVQVGLIMLAVTLVMIIFTVWTNYLISKMSSGISAGIRKDVFAKIMDFSYTEMDKFSASSLITRTTNDVEHVKSMLLMVTQIIVPPIMMVGGIIMALKKSASMSWLIAAGSMFSVAVILVSLRLVIPKIKILQSLTDKFNLIIKERLTGTTIIRAFGNEDFEQRNFKESNTKLTGTTLFVSRIMAITSPFLTILMNIVSIAIIWLGAAAISRSEMNVGDVMAFLQYSAMVISAFLMFSFMFASIPRALVSVDRVFEILDVGLQNRELENLHKLGTDSIKSIEFKNVDFKYPGAEECFLEKINFSAKAGERVGIIGTTGSGKSTLIKLLMGFYEPCGGKIMINGSDSKNIDKSDLRESVAYVPQNGMLFSGTVASNLRLGNDQAQDEELLNAVKISQMYDFTEKNGLDFPISQGGSNVSGGQAQRLAVARALVKKSSFYIFDDSFSKLDFKTDMRLRSALFAYLKNSLVFIVSQRIGTIKNLDKILVLDRGKLVGAGTHEELVGSCGVYSEMVKLQLGDEAI